MLISLSLLLTVGISYTQNFNLVDAGFDVCLSPTAAWADIDNDGDLDVFCSGLDASSTPAAHLYRNDGSGVFTEISSSITGVQFGASAFGDMNNDGLIDLVLTGLAGSSKISRIYRNDGGGTFTDIGASLTGLSNGDAAWADYDNDGMLDLLISGTSASATPQTILYHNNGNESFSNAAAGLTGLTDGAIGWSDVDLDGDMDFAICGIDNSQQPRTIVYINNNSSFSEMGAGLSGLKESSLAWGDYNNNSYPDLILAGADNNGLSKTLVYKNNNGASFTALSTSFNGISSGTSLWGDFNNDGALDFIVAGKNSSGGFPPAPPQNQVMKLYLNQGGDQFQSNEIILPTPFNNVIVCADFDGDSDLDLFVSGSFINPINVLDEVAVLFRNEILAGNTPPSAPAGLTYEMGTNGLSIQWNASTDDHTPSAGLNYNMRIGSQADNMDFMPVMADLSNGYREVVSIGNTSGTTNWSINGLDFGQYYVSVQAIDHSYAGSAFSSNLVVDYAPTASFAMPDSVCILVQASIAYTGNASANAQYNWDFDGGVIVSGSGQGPYQVYWTSAGMKHVSLIVSENGVTSGQVTNNIVISNYPPEPGLISGDNEICQGTLTGEYLVSPLVGVSVYEWGINPIEAGSISGSGVISQVIWNISYSGNAYIFVRGVNSCGPGQYSDSLEVEINPLPGKPGKPSGPEQLCKNPQNTFYSSSGSVFAMGYQWYLLPATAGTLINNGPEAEVNWSGDFSGVAKIFLRSYNDCGSGPKSDTLFVNVLIPPLADAGADQVIPFESSTQLHGLASGGSGDYSYFWMPDDFLLDPSIAEPTTIALTQSRQFILMVTDEVSGCPDNDEMIVSVTGGPLSVIASSSPEEVCENEDVQLLALAGGGSGDYIFSWTSSPEGFTSSEADPVANPGFSTIYYISVFDGTDTVSDSVLVSVNPLPMQPGPISGPEEICAGEEHILFEIETVPYATKYLWTFGDGIYGSSDSTSVLLSFSAGLLPGFDTISVRAINACGLGAVSAFVIEVKIAPERPGIIWGPDTLCTTTDTISHYTLEEAVLGATSYEWAILPEEAGTIFGNTVEAEVHWYKNWEGEAIILLRAQSECGYSDWSEPYSVNAYNCVGIIDSEALPAKLFVYPNPARDVLNVVCDFPGRDAEMTFVMTDLYGRKWIEISVSGEAIHQKINISTLPGGLYIINLFNNFGLLGSGKIIVLK